MANEKTGISRRDALKIGGGIIAGGALGGGAVALLNRGGNQPAPQAPTEPVLPATTTEVDFDTANVKDARSLALLTRTRPRLLQNPEGRMMQFELESLKEGANVLKLTPEQIYQFAPITTNEGKLIAVALPRNDGKVQVYELPKGAELQIAVVDKDNQIIAATGDHPRNLIEGVEYNYLAALAEVEKVKDAKNANAVDFYNDPKLAAGGLVGNYDSVFSKSANAAVNIHRDPAVPTRLLGGTKLSWDKVTEDTLKAALAVPAPKR